jgi:putative transposase
MDGMVRSCRHFITICTHEKERYFGDIVDGGMVLSRTGVIADILWHQIPRNTPNVELGEYVIMPNHIHGILVLNKPALKDSTTVETGHALSLQRSKSIGTNRFQNIGKNTVSSIVGSYKSAVTKHANRLGLENAWQPRYHDHIIRNKDEFQRISDYIKTNPENWEKDTFYCD